MQVFLCFSHKFVLRTHISTHFQGSYCLRGAKVQQFFDIGEVLFISCCVTKKAVNRFGLPLLLDFSNGLIEKAEHP